MNKPFKETVKERLKRDPEFKKAREEEMKIEGDITFRFENIFDSETGAYDEDWENYKRQS